MKTVPSNQPPVTTVPIAADQPPALAWVMKFEFSRFLLAGGISALVNLVGAWCYRWLLEDTFFYFEISVALGFSLGTAISFVLNKYVTFRAHDANTSAQLAKFILVALVSIGLSTVVAHFLLQGMMLLPGGLADTQRLESIAHLLTVGVMTIFNYFAIKYVAFARAVR